MAERKGRGDLLQFGLSMALVLVALLIARLLLMEALADVWEAIT